MLAATALHPIWSRGMAALPIPLGRQAEPEEMAAIVAFLLGPDAGYVHGSVWYADGGTDASVRPDHF
jgi:NAD(P)-dependent dehydrogenase (short-subunit alcohol dehydrogenase family)